MKTEIFIDGSCDPNPDGTMQIAMVESSYKIRKSVGKGNSNIAEYKALIYALSYVARRQLTDVIIHSDFECMVKQINGDYKVHSPNLRPYYERAASLLRLCQSVTIHQIPREFNIADKLFVARREQDGQ